MPFFKLGGWELLIILAVVLILFGPKNLPKLGNALGRTIKSLREGIGTKKDTEAVTEAEGDVIEEIVEESQQPEPQRKVRRVVRKVPTDESSSAS